MNPFLIAILIFAVSAILTGFIRSYAVRKSIIDVPNERSSHRMPTPRGGGLSIVVVFLATLVIMFAGGLLVRSFFLAMFIGGMLVAAVGFWDDHHHIPARWRIVVHFVASGWAIYCLGGMPPFLLGNYCFHFGFFGNIVGVILLVWMLNLFNFMDGIDGIAAVEGVCVAGGAALIMAVNGGHSPLLLPLSLLAGCLGFLVWNWPPAKIFMGDVGSGFLGFVLCLMAFSDPVGQGTNMNMWSWFILSALFVVDATVTLVRRMSKGERFYMAHRSHAYQILSRRFGSHLRVTLGTLVINIIWLMPLAFLAEKYSQYSIVLFVIAAMPIVWAVVKVGAGTAVHER
jgi:Fuc2NAc and GlcNAc transferase